MFNNLIWGIIVKYFSIGQHQISELRYRCTWYLYPKISYRSGCSFWCSFINKNLSNFMLSASSARLSQNTDSSTLPLQPTLWLQIGLHLSNSPTVPTVVPNRPHTSDNKETLQKVTKLFSTLWNVCINIWSIMVLMLLYYAVPLLQAQILVKLTE